MILVAGDVLDSGTAIAWDLLRRGRPALEALEQGVRAVESNVADHSVGIGGYPNALGQVELDAGVMDGRTRASGAVGALRGYLHPVSVAYAVMRRLPHVLLAGDGAARFAREIGAEEGQLLTGGMRQRWLEWSREHGLDSGAQRQQRILDAVYSGQDSEHSGGTTVYLAQDEAGDIAVATSTSGLAFKYPGRLGDTPIAGAGFYADNRYGASACTGQGEIAIRSSLARTTVALMEVGRTVRRAVTEALVDLQYQTDQHTGITVYAIDNTGGHFCGAVYPADHSWPQYAIAEDGDNSPRREPAAGIGSAVSGIG